MTVAVERTVLAMDGSASATTAAAHALFLARVLDVPLQAVSATGTPQSSATEMTETETAGASASTAFEAEETVGAVTRRALLAGVRLTSGAAGGLAATTVVFDVGGNDETRLTGYHAAGTVASRVVHHAEVPILVAPPGTDDGDTSKPRERQ